MQPIRRQLDPDHGPRRSQTRKVGRVRVGADHARRVGGKPRLGSVASVGEEAHVHRGAARHPDDEHRADEHTSRPWARRSRVAPESGEAEASERCERGDDRQHIARHRVEDRDQERDVVGESHGERNLGAADAPRRRQDEPGHARDGERQAECARRGIGRSKAHAHDPGDRERHAVVRHGAGSGQLAGMVEIAGRIDGEEGRQGVDSHERDQGGEQPHLEEPPGPPPPPE